MPTTDPQNEIYDIVNENDEIIGKAFRHQVHHAKSLIHRSITVLIYKNGKLLLQKRSWTKDTYPNYWTSSCGGHVLSGDTYVSTANRELFEELGVKPKHPLTFLGKDLIYYSRETEMMATYKYETSDPIIISKTEISTYRLFPLSKSFFTRVIPRLKMTPDLKFIINKYLIPS